MVWEVGVFELWRQMNSNSNNNKATPNFNTKINSKIGLQKKKQVNCITTINLNLDKSLDKRTSLFLQGF